MPEEITTTPEGTVAETPASPAGAATSETGAAASPADMATSTADISSPPVETNSEPSAGDTVETPGRSDSAKATSENQTGQMGGNEPITENPPQDPTSSADMATSYDSATATSDKESRIRELLEKARFTIQIRKRKKMEKIMGLFQKSSRVTNDEVEKLLHVSDATAERYLDILEKEGKIRRVGSGRGAHYVLAG